MLLSTDFVLLTCRWGAEIIEDEAGSVSLGTEAGSGVRDMPTSRLLQG